MVLQLVSADNRQTTLALNRDLGVAPTMDLIGDVEALLGENRVHFD